MFARRFPPAWSVEEQPRPASSHEKRQLRCDHVKEDSKQDRADHFHFQDTFSKLRSPSSCQLFCGLLRKLKQQWAELYCTDVGAGVKKDSGPYTFVRHATDRGEYRQDAGVSLNAGVCQRWWHSASHRL